MIPDDKKHRSSRFMCGPYQSKNPTLPEHGQLKKKQKTYKSTHEAWEEKSIMIHHDSWWCWFLFVHPRFCASATMVTAMNFEWIPAIPRGRYLASNCLIGPPVAFKHCHCCKHWGSYLQALGGTGSDWLRWLTFPWCHYQHQYTIHFYHYIIIYLCGIYYYITIYYNGISS